MDPVGLVAGSSSETRFRFTLQEGALQRGSYVRVQHEDGPVLAQVTSVTRAKEGLLASAVVLGARDSRGILVAPHTPLRPGDRVLRADDRMVAEVLGLGQGDGKRLTAYLGLLKGTEVPVHLDIDALVQKHASVMAKTGSGKSYVVGVLIEELVKQQVPVLIVDPHGEYGSLANPNHAEVEMRTMRRFGVKPRSYAEHVMEYSPDSKVNPDAVPLKLPGLNLGPRELADLLGAKVTSAQVGLLHQAVQAVQGRRKSYQLKDIVAQVQEAEGSAKWNLVAALQVLEGLDLFADEGTPVTALVRRGQVTVLNLRGSPPEVQEIVVQWVTQALFEARKRDQVPPCMLVVEEAHHFCPERGFQQALSSDVLRTIASEGRKFGLGLCVVSQRPAKVDKNVLSQANTQLILKVTNPHDLKAITSSVEGLDRDAEETIQALQVGTALVSHPRFPVPLQVEIRPRETRHGGSSVSLLDAWRDEDGSAAPGDTASAGPGLPWRGETVEEPEDAEAPKLLRVRRPEAPLEAPPKAGAEPGARPPEAPSAAPLPRSVPPPRPAAPGEAPAVRDLRALFQDVLAEDLRGVPEANLAQALELLQGREATLRGLRAEFGEAPEVQELERLHRAAMTRLRKVLDEREGRGFLGLRRRPR